MITKSPQLAEVAISYKTKIKVSEMPQIRTAEDAATILRAVWDEDKIQHVEQSIVLLLNRQSKVLGWLSVATGGIGGVFIDKRVLFQSALRANASAIIVSHNHPSGNLEPSKNDIQFTKELVAAGKIIEIAICDHIIMTAESHYSLANNGQM